jgi:hypothetical protein
MRRLPPLIRWTRSSTILLSAFFLVIFLIIYVWWPLAEQVLAYIDWGGPWWLYMDWLLIGLFLFMSFAIVARADLRRDALIIFVATIGGLVIEAWGTQTNLWFYYTNERPPLWIVPAWPIATLAIDRITRLMDYLLNTNPLAGAGDTKDAKGNLFLDKAFVALYWSVFVGFLAIMLPFVAPTLDKPYTVAALVLCVVLIATPTDHRRAVLVFVAGAGLGYFLELWGTTRECWTYYTYQTPPLFAVLAHGMAAVSFWRAGLVVQTVMRRVAAFLPSKARPDKEFTIYD